MHKTHIPQHIIDRVIDRRGSAHPFSDLDPARTALVVIDLQNGFMVPGVAHALCETAVQIVPNVNRLARAVRAAGGKVFWVQNTHDDSCLTEWSVLHDYTVREKQLHRVRSMSEGSEGHALYPTLDVQPGDETVQKTRFSAFISGSSDLPQRLKAADCDTVLIVGTVTNVCCDSSARDAMMLNFKTIMVSDANAALTDDEHNAALTAFYATFGDVMDTDHLIACLSRNTQPDQRKAS
ncbi:isochorismatase family protein [Roseinatronobacter sp. NSM]|uniref:isochorismatase family protein n=1 Tax=Roseinatronobacter sp. NSM TaxID=3457785 RepID=UPI00403538D4